MTIQYCSDLHLEFSENLKWINRHAIEPSGEILLLAGDILPFIYLDRFDDFFDRLAAHFTAVYWVPGNHEYYEYDISLRSGSFNRAIRENVFLVNDTTVEIANTRFVFSTLWSHIRPGNAQRMENAIGDFQQIHNRRRPFTAAAFNRLHESSLKFITTELGRKYTGTTVVITHHVPTLLNYPKKYATSDLNEAFVVELDELIKRNGPAYWIYGHHHCNTPDFTIAGTRLLTNQLGYIHHYAPISFDSKKSFKG